MFRKLPGIIAVCLAGLISLPALAAEPLTPAEARQKLLSARPDLPVTSVLNSAQPGYFEVTLAGGMVLYMNDQAEYLFAGDLFRIGPEGLVNATEEARVNVRKHLLNQLDETQMVVFAPPAEDTRATVTVFTDIDCGYCRKLHQEVQQLNDLGIAVRYLAYPRAGVGSPSYDKIVSAWCAEDPRKALTLAKLGQEIEKRTCDNPVAGQLLLGQEFGVTGTPAIVAEDGRLLGGYSPAAELAVRLGLN